MDVRADIFSIGAVLYFLLTGQAPFKERQNAVKLCDEISARAKSPRKVRREIPSSLTQVILKCLQAQPSKRPIDYEALRRALLLPPAALRLRLSAGLYDALVVNAVALVPYSLFRGKFHANVFASSVLSGIIPFWGILSYFALVDGCWAKSVGKWALGLRLVNLRGSRVGVGPRLFRALLFVASIFVLLVLYAVDAKHPDIR
jgi:hypothetical protein